jgi:hypothetical protein
MEIVQKRPVILGLGIVVGFIVGLLIGWGTAEFTGAGPQHMHPRDQANLLRNLADVYAFDNNRDRVHEALGRWDEAPDAICALAQGTSDQASVARLIALAAVLNASGCPGLVAGVPPAPVDEDEGGGGWLLTCFLGLLLLGLLGGIVMVLNRQKRTVGSRLDAGYENPPDTLAISTSGGEQQAIPIARFQTQYTHGRDVYDDSFSIENANGDFLGECGVGISETVGAKGVTAFEIWLFDKNDIRTVTKVIMSDHAFFDEAIKAKLAPKGEPILARQNETIVLETASLIINAQIKALEYSASDLPQSAFEHFSVELSAWAKEGDFGEPDVQGRINELNF